ncbi:hypothetical protein BOTBODRAFT_174252 [Botryobasidium botryosum FD-172 SS1]|uniref:Peptidase S53 domain-containing protein n=1 Tax=Botryobasidium botryosum (strain FD-172 SS1) TaxID=930990 RepID=A0A067MU17_BOTB1|nr:hypothetical protein BOTBODRAFT_174252 [Botryobasidium botryosum FD-172 SS1]
MTCPWVTGIGGTETKPNLTVFDPEQASACGGGFSDLFPLPEYQNQMMRGYSDISTNADSRIYAADGVFSELGGTFVGGAVVGATFALINDARLAAGKGPIGFVNPMLYKNAQALNDIMRGNNPGCGTPGFSAVPGWDPITGLGTPDFKKLLDLFLSQ